MPNVTPITNAQDTMWTRRAVAPNREILVHDEKPVLIYMRKIITMWKATVHNIRGSLPANDEYIRRHHVENETGPNLLPTPYTAHTQSQLEQRYSRKLKRRALINGQC